MASFDFSDISNFSNQLDRNMRNIDEDISNTLNKIGTKGLRLVKLKTPVDKGVLRRSWQGKKEEYQYTLSNNVEYAPHVNYGHRVGKSMKVVEGVYMLEKTIEELQDEFIDEMESIIENLWE